ncbi:MAG: ATP-dependent sacrificial sulfur transferase LarE [Acidobacteriota bacterium]|nr:ATP-dependent sacrificial sulfur transferase LarE [Acidobacteriota bacterium]
MVAAGRTKSPGEKTDKRQRVVSGRKTRGQLEAGLARKYERLKEELKLAGSALVAFSGGVDSSLLLRVAADVLEDRVLAVIIDAPVFSREEILAAQHLASNLKVPFMTVKVDNLKVPEVVKNTEQRCYHCKLFLFSRLKKIARQKGLIEIIEGSNFDDAKDYRPGKKAVEELNIRSPLEEAGFSKDDVRNLAKYLGLPNWPKPPAACLASRIPYGQSLDRNLLGKIEKGEKILKSLGFGQVRLRHHGELARIEIDQAEFELWLKPEVREKAVTSLIGLGYRYVALDLAGYRTGSLNPERG